MSAGNSRKFVILEPLMAFAMIIGYIWRLRFTHPGFWIPILALILLTHLARHERAAALGFNMLHFRQCLRRFSPLLAALVVVMVGAGVLLQTLRPMGFEQALFSLGLYLPWGVFQQYLLNGYFLRRFDIAFPPQAASVVTAALFSGVHAPNWFLMAVTLVAGYCATRVYRRYPNLYFLGLAHAILGFLLFLVVPDSLSHHLNVGPRWLDH
jgi:membrane protease YdiL (CAAX protease family)